MKNIRSISIAALSAMLLLSTTASHGMWKSIVNFAQQQGSNLVATAKAYPVTALITVTAIAAAGYVACTTVAKILEDQATIEEFEQAIVPQLQAMNDFIQNGNAKVIGQFDSENLTIILRRLSMSQKNLDIQKAAGRLIKAIDMFDKDMVDKIKKGFGTNLLDAGLFKELSEAALALKKLGIRIY
jgi:hypothetical protein